MIAIMLDIKCCGSGASRLLVGKSSRQSQNQMECIFTLPRAHSRITTTERALKHTSVSPAQWVRVPLICANTISCYVPWLINHTSGTQCAEFVYNEYEDLADLQAITPPSEQHHCLHLSLWSVYKKSAKSLTKTIGKSTRWNWTILAVYGITPFPQPIPPVNALTW